MLASKDSANIWKIQRYILPRLCEFAWKPSVGGLLKLSTVDNIKNICYFIVNKVS